MTNTARTRLAVAELTATLTTDFDVPTLLQSVARHARDGFDAYSAVVVLLDRHGGSHPAVHLVAEALRHGISADPLLHNAGPGLSSARDGTVTMIGDIVAEKNPRWASYRQRAMAAGLRGVRAFPVTAFGLPLGALVVHTDNAWGTLRPNDFGQTLADLVAIALSSGPIESRRASTSDNVDAVLRGTTVISFAVGVLAEYFQLDVEQARDRLLRLARTHGRTPTAHAREIIAALHVSPVDPAVSGALHEPPELAPPRHIDL
ncbi:GAF and ANTAR domain-containing protein [Nocardia sp. XZ_19_385]|uniref:GAF and ANTAR domain-containing protein n=1 Tax=Nocardia sp. XZ_19_385 TaxID=2769488 RepID=UPI00188F21E4|nr:GAF and ANTAR domain-containing protein [Nocardia sp. XZ_19_385]